jgi:uncharacterized protein DUF1902
MQSTLVGLTKMPQSFPLENDERIVIRAMWDGDAHVWFAESDHVPGLALEAESLDELAVELDGAIPALLKLNNVPRAAPGPTRPYRIIASLDRVPSAA